MNRSIKCVIIDDEEMAIKVIQSHLSHVPNFEIVGIYHSAIESFLELDKLDIDVMFLDIQMPKMTGISLLKMIKNPPITVFTTAYRDYAIEGFELDVIDYLLKPFSLGRFLKTIQKINTQIELIDSSSNTKVNVKSHREFLFVRSNREMKKIYLDDIIYIQAVKNHIKIVTVNQKIISLIGISEFHAKLDNKIFLRVHRSYIINKSKVSSFNNTHIKADTYEFPIGKSYQKSIEGSMKCP